MLDTLEKRVPKKEGETVIVDRVMAFQKNIDEIKEKGYHYIVATRQSERNEYLDEFEEGEFNEVIRSVSPTNPSQKKSGVLVKKIQKDDELLALCISEGRSEKDKAIRESHEKKLVTDLKKLAKRITKGRLKKEEKIYEAIGRIKERNLRVARYYKIEYNSLTRELTYKEETSEEVYCRNLRWKLYAQDR